MQTKTTHPMQRLTAALMTVALIAVTTVTLSPMAAATSHTIPGDGVCDDPDEPTEKDDCQSEFPSKISKLLGALEDVLLKIGAPLAGVVILVGGLMLAFGQGNENRTRSGKQVIVGAMVGLLVMLSASALVGFIASSV